MDTTNLETNWIPDTDTFGARLALVRWQMGWNVKEAERECGLSQNTWAGWEEGATPRKLIEVVDRIAQRTNVDKYWLITGEGVANRMTGIENVVRPLGLEPRTHWVWDEPRTIANRPRGRSTRNNGPRNRAR